MSVPRSDMDTVYPPVARPHETRRGEMGMTLFIATEAMLFAMLFFAYYYLAFSRPHWPPTEDPTYQKALIMLGILFVSSLPAQLAVHSIRKNVTAGLAIWLAVTLAFGGGFIYVSVQEYADRLSKLTPAMNAYGSIFYTILSLHLAHVVLGLFMLLLILARALAGHFNAERHVAVRNVVAYWHFVNITWVLVVLVLYVTPHFYRSLA